MKRRNNLRYAFYRSGWLQAKGTREEIGEALDLCPSTMASYLRKSYLDSQWQKPKAFFILRITKNEVPCERLGDQLRKKGRIKALRKRKREAEAKEWRKLLAEKARENEEIHRQRAE